MQPDIARYEIIGHYDTMLSSHQNRAAKLHYMPNNFRLLSPGNHIICAISGAQVPLEDLRYWSVAKQEGYASAELSVQAALSELD